MRKHFFLSVALLCLATQALAVDLRCQGDLMTVGTIITSFDVWAQNLPRIEIYGSAGSLVVPDPNGFGGEVKLWTPEKREWTVVPHSHPYPENSRGIGDPELRSCGLRLTAGPFRPQKRHYLFAKNEHGGGQTGEICERYVERRDGAGVESALVRVQR